MVDLLHLLLTFAVAVACGCLLWRLHVPGGMMVGAIIGVMALNISTGLALMPYYAKLTAQIIAGAFIGSTVEKDDLRQLPHLIAPLTVVLLSFLTLNLLVGFILWKIGPMDLLTSLLCAVPGGMSDTPLIAADMGADAGKVAVLQFVRMTVGIGAFPSLIAAYDRKKGSETDPLDLSAREREDFGHTPFCFILTLAVASSGGLLGFCSGIPAGTLVASMLGVILFKLLTGRAWLPMWAKRAAQILSGAYIGCSMGYRDLLELKYLILPALVILIAFTANCFAVGTLMHRVFGMERKAAMLSATPAGATDMALISSDIGVHNTDLIVIQILRMVLVISIFPQIIGFVVKWVG